MRCPFALDEDSLLYFIQYKTFKDKGVRMAAKSLISLFRVINPKLLPKKERVPFSSFLSFYFILEKKI